MTEKKYEPGDKITIIIEGVIPAEGVRSTVVSIHPENPRPGTAYPLWNDLSAWKGFGDAVETYGVANARVSVTKVSRYKNGVHIDLVDGSYWMRRPDGWHIMSVGSERFVFESRTAPQHPQRLKEDR